MLIIINLPSKEKEEDEIYNPFGDKIPSVTAAGNVNNYWGKRTKKRKKKDRKPDPTGSEDKWE